MEKTKMTEKESLELISQMIQSTKEKMNAGSGNRFLIYGYMAVFISLAIFALTLFMPNAYLNMIWILMFAPQIYLSIKDKKEKGDVVTYTDRMIQNTWLIISTLFGLTFCLLGIMGIVLGYKVDYSIMLPLSLLYAGIGTSITGVVIKEAGVTYTPLIGFIFAIYMLISYSNGDGSSIYWNLFFGFAMMAMMVIPGHILNNKAKKSC
jgi:hypothetical protein